MSSSAHLVWTAHIYWGDSSEQHEQIDGCGNEIDVKMGIYVEHLVQVGF